MSENLKKENELEIKEGETLSEVETNESATDPKQKMAWIVTLAIVALIAIIGIAWIVVKRTGSSESSKKKEDAVKENSETGREVKLEQGLLNSAGIAIEGVTQRPAIAKLYVTGSVEMNPEKTEMATPLVGGRIEKVNYGVGDYVNQGAVMATISSPQIAQLHGKMHEARTRYELAERNLTRVQKSENRVGVLSAKAKLDETEANLKRTKIQNESNINQAKAKLNESETKLNRTKKLIELGAGAGKDLIAAQTAFQIEKENLQSALANKDVITAESAYKTAKAQYDFQNNIGLNKEIQEAQADVETSRVDLIHIVDEMRSLGVQYDLNQPDDHSKDTSLVAVRAPLSGQITERKFNAGAGIEAAMPIFAISNMSTIYVVANVPEANVSRLSVGSIAEIESPVTGTIKGRISFIEPQLDVATRTARVRLEVPNSNGKLRAGMFTEVGFYAGTNDTGGEELVVSSEAVQRTGGKTVVFLPRENEAGTFEVREIEIGGETEGYAKIISGLKLGEKVVTKGSFTLKTQLEKGAMEEE